MKRLLAFIATSICFVSCIWAAAIDLSTVESNITLVDDTVARFALHGRPAPKNLAKLKAGNIHAKQTAGAKGARLLQASGPSYPASIGGNKSYEYISSFTVTPKDGYYKITVKVICPQLYNAEGYPNYGSETEFVNVWIDWNGDYSWSASERVMAKSSANYKKILADNKILYFETTVKDASTVGGTFKARAMLGWGYNPTNPATYSWAWGDVMDKSVVFDFAPPEISGLSIGAFADAAGKSSTDAASGVNPKVNKNNAVIAGRQNYIYPRIRIKENESEKVLSKNFKVKFNIEWNNQRTKWEGKINPQKIDSETISGVKYGIYNVVPLNNNFSFVWTPAAGLTDKSLYGAKKINIQLDCSDPSLSACMVPQTYPFYMFYEANAYVDGKPMWFTMWKSILDDLKKFQFEKWIGLSEGTRGMTRSSKTFVGKDMKKKGDLGIISWNHIYSISAAAWNIDGEIPITAAYTQSQVPYHIDSVLRTLKHELLHGEEISRHSVYEVGTKKIPNSEQEQLVYTIQGDEGFLAWCNRPLSATSPARWVWEWWEGDLLVPAHENVYGTDSTKCDTFNLARINSSYSSSGDQEYYVRRKVDDKRASIQQRKADWSYPGAQLTESMHKGPVKSMAMIKNTSDSSRVIQSSDLLQENVASFVMNIDSWGHSSEVTNLSFTSFVDSTYAFETDGLRLSVGLTHSLTGTWSFTAYLLGTNGTALASAHTENVFDESTTNVVFVFSSDVLVRIRDFYTGPYVLGRVVCEVPNDSFASVYSPTNVLTTKDYSAYECKVTKPLVGSAMSDYADDDGLHVVMPVNVPSDGIYAISAHLATTNGENLVNVTTNCVCVEGRNEIDICFPKGDVFNTKVTGRFMVRDVSVAADDEESALFVCDYETNPYDYFDFGDGEKSITILPETVVLSASQDDDDSGELYNGVSVKFVADNYDYDDETLYRVSAVLVDTNGYNVTYAEEDMMVNGYANLSLFFSAQAIRESGRDGPYSVRWLKISDRETGELIDACAVSDAKTDILVSGDFKGGIQVDEDAMQLSDMPIGNGLYAGLQLVVPVNVPSDGYVTLSAFVYTADGKLVERFESERAVVSGDNQLILHMDGAQFRDSGMDGPYVIRSIEVRHSSFPEHPCVVERVFNTDAYTHTQFFGLGRTRFEENVLQVDEGENVVVRISGGSTNVDSNVQVFLMYNTGVAADLDLANGTVDGVMPKGGLKFPLTLNWEAGEVGEKVVAIPAKTDKVTEDDEFFTLQLADPHGMELGERRVCKVTIHDPGYDLLGEKVGNNSATPAEIKAWEKLQAAKAPYILGIADPANAGKVTGSGVCAVGKKVTLKATANKGFVFVGWTDTQIAMDGDRIASGAVSYLATTPSLVIDRTAKPTANSKTSTTITDVNDDVTYYANFVTVEEDGAAISLAVYGLNLAPLESGMMPVWTNICGVAVDWLVAAAGLSATTVKAAGLPQGLKLVQDKETGQYFVQGAPTAASKIDAKTGIVTPSKVSFTVTTAGKTSEVFGINLIVLPLPDWAQGTFTGVVDVSDDEGSSSYGFATMSVAANGKISGKMTLNGTNWTFGASCYAWRYNNSYMEDSDEYVFRSEVEAKSGKATRWFTIDVSSLSSSGAFANGVAYSWGNDVGLTMWRNMWKDKVTAAEAKAELAKWEGVYTLSFLPGDDYGSGYLSLTVGKDGNVKASGKLADGTSLSALSPLLYDVDVGYFAYLYMTSSSYKGGALSLAVGFDDGEGAVATQGVGAKLGGRLGIARWTSFNPQATGVYGEGFSREMAFVGAYYHKGMMLGEYYETLRLSMVAPALAYTYKETYLGENVKKVTVSSAATTTAVDTLWQSGLTVAVSDKGAFVVAKATKPVQDKETKEWSYVGDNDGALTLSFAQATGIFKGSYTFWYDYVSAEDETVEPAKATMAHTSKKVAFEGVLVPGMEEMRGFYLWDATGTYEDPKTGKEKTYKYKESHPVSLVEP